MEDQVVRKLSPEVALIGVLLIVAGIAETIYGVVFVRSILTQHDYTAVFLRRISLGAVLTPLPLVEFWVILHSIISVAGLVCGVALLFRARWGLRGTQITLIALIVLLLISGLVKDVIFPLYPYLQIGFTFAAVKTALITFFAGILSGLKYVVMLLFLSSTRAREPLEEDRQPGRLQALADRLQRLFPAEVTPVLSLVGLLLISQAIPALLHMHDALGSYKHPPSLGGSDLELPYTGTWLALIIISKILIIAFPVGAIIGCSAIFVLKMRSLPFVLAVLLIGCAESIIPFFTALFIEYSIDTWFEYSIQLPYILPAFILPLSDVVTYLVMGVFLVWYRNVRSLETAAKQ